MERSRIFLGLAVLAIFLSSTTINPSIAVAPTGPAPVPGNLIPIPPAFVPMPSNPLPVVPLLPAPSLYSIDKVNSGLVASDSLTNETLNKQQLLSNPRYWTYGGSAQVLNTPYDLFKDSQGLHIGVQSLQNGSYTGFYGVTPNTNAKLFHAVVSTQPSTLPIMTDFYESGLYVQTAGIPNINYVTCTSDTSFWGTSWAVIWATFNAFLEPQTSYPSQMLYGTYKDYYAATDESIKVTNNPSLAAKVMLVDSTGNVLASSSVVSGNASLVIGQYHMPLAAYIKVYDSNDIQLASTKTPVNIFGGDTYSVNLNPGL
ncbi:MAG: hypothetical protein E6K83_05840 [Thaumarchaeota archaeon]|nr:MAG: hypothetical protein E6K83_05840 [Nitrososphaerota archaeon]